MLMTCGHVYIRTTEDYDDDDDDLCMLIEKKI